MEFRNLTPHPVAITIDGQTTAVAIPSVGVARAIQRDVPLGSVEIDGVLVPVVQTVYEGTDGLPEPTEGVRFIVSSITIEAARAAGRVTNDLLFPSGFAKRDANGQIIGVSALAQAR